MACNSGVVVSFLITYTVYRGYALFKHEKTCNLVPNVYFHKACAAKFYDICFVKMCVSRTTPKINDYFSRLAVSSMYYSMLILVQLINNIK